MIKLFSENDINFSSNGEKIIIPSKAKIHKEDNGNYYLDLETDLSYLNILKKDKIIVANTPNGEDSFRIGNIEKNKNKIKIRCWHLFYDTKNYLILDSYIVNKNCNDALDHINNATDNSSPFSTISDINKLNSFRCVRKSLYEAVSVILERWGGHLVRNAFNIEIRNKIGNDNGVLVRYGKNLKDISCSDIWDSVVTKLLPVGKDGILLPEKYIYSKKQYNIPYTKSISFEQNDIDQENYKSEDEYKTALIEDLRKKAQDYVEINSVPKVNYTLKANLEKISDVGDFIEVVDERLNINIITQLIAFEYDCILEKYTELQFGNFNKKLSELSTTITNETKKEIDESNNVFKVTLGKELSEIKKAYNKFLGNSYQILESDRLLFVDSLPKETAKNVMMISSAGIAFSQNGIEGDFNSAWTIDGTMDMQKINVINLVADMIKGGTLKLGSSLNQSGIIEVYDETNKLICVLDKNGLKMYGKDDSQIILNSEVGFVGFDKNKNKTFWVDKDEFHMKKSIVEEEITFFNKQSIIPLTIIDENNKITNDGIALISRYKERKF